MEVSAVADALSSGPERCHHVLRAGAAETSARGRVVLAARLLALSQCDLLCPSSLIVTLHEEAFDLWRAGPSTGQRVPKALLAALRRRRAATTGVAAGAGPRQLPPVLGPPHVDIGARHYDALAAAK